MHAKAVRMMCAALALATNGSVSDGAKLLYERYCTTTLVKSQGGLAAWHEIDALTDAAAKALLRAALSANGT